jgi:hypothetical protein
VGRMPLTTRFFLASSPDDNIFSRSSGTLA